MGKGLALLSLSTALCACVGGVGALPGDDVTYSFQAAVTVMTVDPTPGRRVDFNVAVTSTGNSPVHCDVTLNVAVPDGGAVLYTQQWTDVLFEPDNMWNLSNGFLPATDVQSTYEMGLTVRRSDDGMLLYDEPNVTQLTFPSM